MTAREDAIAAIARALHSDNCFDDVDWGKSCDCADWDREARIAYEAAEPIIRADERERIAQEIQVHLAARRRVKELLDERKHFLSQVLALLGGESE